MCIRIKAVWGMPRASQSSPEDEGSQGRVFGVAAEADRSGGLTYHSFHGEIRSLPKLTISIPDNLKRFECRANFEHFDVVTLSTQSIIHLTSREL